MKGRALDLTPALVNLVYTLARLGLVDTRRLVAALDGLDRVLFVCSGRLDYTRLSDALRRGPVLIECDRRRAYYAARRLEEMLGRTVHRRLVGRGLMNIYILYLDGQEEEAERLVKAG